MTSTSTRAAMPKGPSNGAMISCTSSIGFALDVSTTCTRQRGGWRLGRRSDGTVRFAGLLRNRRRGFRRPTRQFLFQLLDRVRQPRERAPFWHLEGMHLGHDVALVFGQLRCEIDQLRVRIQPAAPKAVKISATTSSTRRDAANPTLDARDQRRKEKGEQRRKRQRNEQFASEIKRRDNERRQHHRPNADQRFSGGGFRFARGHGAGGRRENSYGGAFASKFTPAFATTRAGCRGPRV